MQYSQKIKKKIKLNFSEPLILNNDFFSRLTILECLFHSSNLLQEQISEFIDMISTAVEYYDSIKDPIKSYFQDKMAFILSRKEILISLVNKKQQINTISNINDSIMEDEILDANEESKSNSQQKLSQVSGQISNKQRPSVQKKKIILQYKVNIEQSEKEQNEQVKDIIQQYEEKQGNVKEMIVQDIKTQENVLEQRLKNRKSKRRKSEEIQADTTELVNNRLITEPDNEFSPNQINIRDVPIQLYDTYKQITSSLMNKPTFQPNSNARQSIMILQTPKTLMRTPKPNLDRSPISQYLKQPKDNNQIILENQAEIKNPGQNIQEEKKNKKIRNNLKLQIY